MRWDAQRVDRDGPMTLPGMEGEGLGPVRTFTAPEAMGMRFHEVRAKSALNRVPGGAYGFNWTVNPYRGCSHACVYCFARPTHAFLGHSAGLEFERDIYVKVNAVEQLRRELADKRQTLLTAVVLGYHCDAIAQQANGHPPGRQSGEVVDRAIDRVYEPAPPVRHPRGSAELFPVDGVLWEGLAQAATDKLLDCPVGLRDPGAIGFARAGHGAPEVQGEAAGFAGDLYGCGEH